MIEETLQSSDEFAKPVTPTAAGAAATPASADTASTADKSFDGKPAHAPPIPRWLLNVVGHAIAGALGLLLGYFILHWLYPELFQLPW
jgi:hypothetical protein